MKLYTYFRSATSFRTRIALNIKGIEYEPCYVHLRKGEQHDPAYLKLNPGHCVPTLVDGDNVLIQSPAIIEYLEETHPEPPLLPTDPVERARVRAIAMAVAVDIHPIDNLRVLNYVRDAFGQDEEGIQRWYNHWIAEGLERVEAMLADDPRTGTYCHGDTVTLADVYLVPQVFGARRFGYDTAQHPTITRVFDACMKLEAFDRAQPSKQPDAE